MFHFTFTIIMQHLKAKVWFNCMKWQQILIYLLHIIVYLFLYIRDCKTIFIKGASKNNAMLQKEKNAWCVTCIYLVFTVKYAN